MLALLKSVRDEFAAVPVAAPFLADWPEVAISRVLEPVQLPVCRWLAGDGG